MKRLVMGGIAFLLLTLGWEAGHWGDQLPVARQGRRSLEGSLPDRIDGGVHVTTYLTSSLAWGQPDASISASPGPPTTPSGGSGDSTTLMTGEDVAALVEAGGDLLQALARGFGEWMNSWWPFKPDARPDPLPRPLPTPPPFGNPSFDDQSPMFHQMPHGPGASEAFRRDVLERADASLPLKANPHEGEPHFSSPPSGVDPYRPGATRNGRPPTLASAGDPVSLGDGALELSQTDLEVPGPVRPLVFRRAYHSGSNARSHLGSNWTHNFDVYLEEVRRENAPPFLPHDAVASNMLRGSAMLLHDGVDGARLFVRPANSAVFITPVGTNETLERDGAGRWHLRDAHGRVRIFNRLGYLVEDRDRFGNGFTLEYEPTPLYTLYQRYVASGRLAPDDKPAIQLAYVFGEHHVRQFLHTPDYAYGVTKIYYDFFKAYDDGGCEPGSCPLLDRVLANDPEDRLNASVRSAGALHDVTIFDLMQGLDRLVEDLALFRSLQLGRQGLEDVCRRSRLSCRALLRIYDQLVADGLFVTQDGLPRRAFTTAERDRIRNFNVGLVIEVLYPDDLRTPHEEASHPDFAPLQEDPASVPAYVAPAAAETVRPTRYSDSTWFVYAHRIMRGFLFDDQGRPVSWTRDSLHGGRKLRLVRVTDDLRRAFVFHYYDPEGGPRPEAGLLKEVTGPEGITVRYHYTRPFYQPHQTNEMFVRRVDREDHPAPGVGVQAAPARNYLFDYQWHDGGSAAIQEMGWVVWRLYEMDHRPFAIPAAAHYYSTASDNIIRVRRNVETTSSVIELETAYMVHPQSPDFDRVVAQRYGGTETSPRNTAYSINGHRLITWHTGYPQMTFEYSPAAPREVVRWLPREVAERYPLEQLPAHIQPLLPASSETFTAPYFDPMDDAMYPRLRRSWVGRQEVSAATRYLGLEIVYDAENHAYRLPTRGGLSFPGIQDTRERTGRDVNRITHWVKLTTQDAQVIYRGLNFQGQVLTDAVFDQDTNRYVFWERTYNADGQLVAQRRPRRGTSPWGVTHGATIHEYAGVEHFSPAAWRARLNRVRTLELPAGGRVQNLTVPATNVSRPPDVWAASVPSTSAGRITGYRYEPVFNQLTELRAGVLALDGSERIHAIVRQEFDCSEEDAACRRMRPDRIVYEAPAMEDSPRVVEMSWSPAGQLTQVREAHGRQLELAYYEGLGDTPDASIAPEHGGMLARIVERRLDLVYPPEAGPSAAPNEQLRGPYQWLLPAGVDSPEDALRKLGLPPAAVQAIVQASDPNSSSQLSVWRFRYSRLGHVVEEALDDLVTSYRRDTDGRVLEMTTPDGLTTTYQYSREGNLEEAMTRDVERSVWRRTAWRHDVEGRVLEAEHYDYPDGLRGLKTQYEYTPGGRLFRVTDPEGTVHERVYDSLGEVAEERSRSAGAVAWERLARYRYTDDGDLRAIDFGTDATRGQDGRLGMVLTYDGLRRMVTTRDEHERQWRYAYTERDEVSLVEQNFTDPQEAEDARHHGRSYASRTRLAYDGHGRFLVKNQEDMELVRVAYTPAGDVYKIVASGGGTTFATFDRRGARLWSRDAAGNETVRTWDPQRRVAVEAIIRRGHEGKEFLTTAVETHFDTSGRAMTTIEHGGDGTQRTTTWERNPAGHVTRRVGPDGSETRQATDLLGRVRWHAVQRGEGEGYDVSHFTHNRRGQITAVQDPSGTWTRYVYDGLGQQTEEQRPGFDRPFRWEYDGYGRVRRRILPDGDSIRRVYARNYPVVDQLEGPGGGMLVSRRYDERGRLRQVVDHNRRLETLGLAASPVELRLEYDALDRLTSQAVTLRAEPREQKTVTSRWTLGHDSWLRATRYPTGTEWSHHYDALGRLVAAKRGEPETALSFAYLGDLYRGRVQHWRGGTPPLEEGAVYDALGQRVRWEYRGGEAHRPLTMIDVIRDVRGRIGSLQMTYGHLLLSPTPAPPRRPWRGYSYDLRGHLSRVWERDERTEVFVPGLENHYADRLAIDVFGASMGGRLDAWDYRRETAVGSLLVIDNSKTAEQRWATSGREVGYALQDVVFDGQRFPVAHDAQKRVVKQLGTRLVWDPQGRLAAQVSDHGRIIEAYAYDGLGRLAALYGSEGLQATFVHDGVQMIAAYDGEGQPLWEAAWGPGLDQLVEWRDLAQERSYVPVADHRNSIMALWDIEDGAVVERSEYDPHGRVTRFDASGRLACQESSDKVGCASQTGLPFGFTSAFTSPRTGLVYLRNRWYAPHLAQFVSPDPLVQLVMIKYPNDHAARAGAAAMTLATDFVDQLNGCAC